ncbi:hypothetical protein ACLKA6_004774 [Drosophila palustris]
MWNFQLVTLISACVVAVSGQDFGYGHYEHGPEHWAEDYKRCSGKFQSPINIDELNVEKRDYPDLEYYNFDSIPKSVHIKNNGHTVLVTMSFAKGKEPRVRGGPLETKAFYQFEQFHFHWGENDTVGSEDTINNQAFPAEMHVVVRSLDYPDFDSALGQDHGIAVLAYFFKIRNYGSASYSEFTRLLPSISRKGESTDLSKPLPLMSYVSKDPVNYYSYVGSLTTPPCAEEVVWIDFREPISISDDQLEKFRLLTENDDHLKNNFRPTQPLNNRTVYQRIPIPFDHATSRWGELPLERNSAAKIRGSLIFLLGSLLELFKANILVAFN